MRHFCAFGKRGFARQSGFPFVAGNFFDAVKGKKSAAFRFPTLLSIFTEKPIPCVVSLAMPRFFRLGNFSFNL